MCKIRSSIIIAILFVGLFAGILNISLNSEADIQGDWIEEIIRDVPTTVRCVAIGDVDLDGKNEVVIGQYDTTYEVRMYKKESGLWKETLIADTPVSVTNLVVGDADNDGVDEIVCTLTSPTNQVRMYEYASGSWNEQNITTAPAQIYALALGDADNDQMNEVVIGMVTTTNNVRAYQKSGALWYEQNITDVPHDVAKVAVGDADNDDLNEVVIGMSGNNPVGFPPVYITNEIRSYEWNGTAWPEENITDTGNMDINSLVIGDPDSDSKNEVCFGTWSVMGGNMEARTYEYKWGGWQLEYSIPAAAGNTKWIGGVGDTDNDGKNELILMEGSYMGFGTAKIEVWENISYFIYGDIVASNLPIHPQTAIGDCDSDGINEIAVGLVSSSYEVRLYANDRGKIRFTSHYGGEYISGTEYIEVAVTSNYVDAVRFYVNDMLNFTDTVYPYQFLLDTTVLVEDAIYTIKAEGVRGHNSPLVTTINLEVNNNVPVGDYISVSTLKSTYSPDQDVTVLIGLKSPPSFTTLNLIVSYDDPSGNTLYSVEKDLPYSSQYMMILPLQSDAEQGTYTVSVEAYGISKGMMVWSGTNTTTFDVAGKSIQEQLEDMNATLALMNVTLFNIQSDLAGMNLTGLLGAIDYLNQSLGSIESQLAGLNDSIQNTISGIEGNILANLADVNTSLYNEIQNLLNIITDDITDLNGSLSEQLTSILENVTSGNNALQSWLDVVLSQIKANLTAANETLHAQLASLEFTTQTFYDDMLVELSEVFNSLAQLEGNLSLQHTAILDAVDTLNDTIAGAPGLSTGDILDRINDSIAIMQNLNASMTTHDTDIQNILNSLMDLVANQGNLTRDQLLQNASEILGQMQDLNADIVSHDNDVKENLTTLQDLINNIGAMDISEIMSALSDLEGNLSAHDDALAQDMADIEQAVEDFQSEIEGDLDAINTTLDELEKLQTILDDIQELNDDLQAVSDSVDEIPTEKEEKKEFGVTEILLIIILILLVINLLLMLIGRKGKASDIEEIPEGRAESEGMAFEKAETKEEIKEEDEEELTCLECGTVLGPGQTVCPKCGAEYEIEEVEEENEELEEEPEEEE